MQVAHHPIINGFQIDFQTDKWQYKTAVNNLLLAPVCQNLELII